MTLKSKLFFIKKHLLSKRNILLIIIFTIINLILITASVFYTVFSSEYKPEELEYRRLTIYKKDSPNDLTMVNNINHIIYQTNKDYDNIFLNPKSFKYKDQEGELTLSVLYQNEKLKVLKGKNILEKNEMICPNDFYPHNTYNNLTGKYKIYNKGFIKTSKELGNIYNIEINHIEVPLKLVGTYNNYIYNNDFSTCYVSEETLNDLGFNKETKHKTIIVDKNSNIDYVLNKINNLGFDVRLKTKSEYYYGQIAIPIFAIIIVYLISFIIIHNFNKKKIKNNLNLYGILKSCGYSNKEITSIVYLENILLYVLCIIISYIISFLIYNLLLSSNILTEFLIYSYMKLRISLDSYLLIYLLSLVLILISSKILLQQNLKRSVDSLLKEN